MPRDHVFNGQREWSMPDGNFRVLRWRVANHKTNMGGIRAICIPASELRTDSVELPFLHDIRYDQA